MLKWLVRIPEKHTGSAIYKTCSLKKWIQLYQHLIRRLSPAPPVGPSSDSHEWVRHVKSPKVRVRALHHGGMTAWPSSLCPQLPGVCYPSSSTCSRVGVYRGYLILFKQTLTKWASNWERLGQRTKGNGHGADSSKQKRKWWHFYLVLAFHSIR